MSKSSKKRKRAIKLIRTEAVMLGKESLEYESFAESPREYLNERLNYFKRMGISNKEIVSYLRHNVIPDIKNKKQLDMDFGLLCYASNVISQSQNQNIKNDVIEHEI